MSYKINEMDRYKNEAEFFDREADKVLSHGKTFKLTNTKTHVELFNEIPHLRQVVPFFGELQDKRVLDLACGDGWTSLYMARSGANVFSCDVSSKCIELATKYAEHNELKDKIHAEVMAAERLSFEDEFFDFVFMNAGLHHCDIDKTIAQIKRVLKKGGKAAFSEDYAYHPILKIYRLLTEHKHTKHENALFEKDVFKIISAFKTNNISYYGLLNLVDSNSFISNTLEYLDQRFFESIPALRKYSRIICIYVEK